MKELWFFFPTVIRTRRERRIVPAFQKNSDKQKSLPSVSRKGLSVPYEARMRKQKTPHDNKTDLSVSFFIRCLGSLIRTNAWYSQPCGWRASQCCSAYALQRSLFSCVGIIARLFVFCNRKNEQIFVFRSIVGIYRQVKAQIVNFLWTRWNALCCPACDPDKRSGGVRSVSAALYAIQLFRVAL